MAGIVAKHPLPNGVLEVLQELWGEGGGFVETEAGLGVGRSLARILTDNTNRQNMRFLGQPPPRITRW